MIDGAYFSQPHVDWANAWFARYASANVGGKRVRMPVLDWEKRVIDDVFGWRRADGRRLRRNVFLSMGKKNGKTPFCATLILCAADMENIGGNIASCATTEKQSGLTLGEAIGQVRYSESLKQSWRTMSGHMIRKTTGKTWSAVTGSESANDGMNLEMLTADELHRHKTPFLLDIMRRNLSAAHSPLAVYTTTAGDPSVTHAYDMYQRCKKIQSGELIDPDWSTHIFEAPADADWRDESIYAHANPSIGYGVTMENLLAYRREATDSPEAENRFKRYHLNWWMADQKNYFHVADWDALDSTQMPADGTPIWIGLDMSLGDDLTAIGMVWIDSKTGKYCCHAHYFTVDYGLDARTVAHGVRYRDMQNLTILPGKILSHDAVIDFLRVLSNRFDIQSIAIDRYQAGWIFDRLETLGIKAFGHGQGWMSMNQPIRQMKECVTAKTLMHTHDPLTRWMIANFQVARDKSGNLSPDRKSRDVKIDGCIAILMALGRAYGMGASLHDDFGVMVL